MRPPRRVSSTVSITPETVSAAIAALSGRQELYNQTRSVHAAAYWQADTEFAAIREDVGRHNALDKLIGAVVQQGIKRNDGIVLVTSRVSVELVQKTAALGAPFLIAVSAPTALAVRACAMANITLVGIARGDGFEVFTHSERIAAC
jgi:FdhD protein